MKTISKVAERFFIALTELRNQYLCHPLTRLVYGAGSQDGILVYETDPVLFREISSILEIYMDDAYFFEELRSRFPHLERERSKIIEFTQKNFPQKIKIEITRDIINSDLHYRIRLASYMIHDNVEIQLSGFEEVSKLNVEKSMKNPTKLNDFVSRLKDICEQHSSFVTFEYKEKINGFENNLTTINSIKPLAQAQRENHLR